MGNLTSSIVAAPDFRSRAATRRSLDCLHNGRPRPEKENRSEHKLTVPLDTAVSTAVTRSHGRLFCTLNPRIKSPANIDYPFFPPSLSQHRMEVRTINRRWYYYDGLWSQHH